MIIDLTKNDMSDHADVFQPNKSDKFKISLKTGISTTSGNTVKTLTLEDA